MTALRKMLFPLAIGLAALVPSACAPTEVAVSAHVAAPRLVLVAPGVWLVEDSPYAVYYYDGFYWRFYDGIWYRSLYYDSGFIGVNVGIVPRVVVHNYRPAHVHYRAPHTARTRAIVRDHRSDRPVVRDHRRDNRRDNRRRHR